MDLGNAYNSVSHSPLHTLYTNKYAPIIERDPCIQGLEHSVSRQIAALAPVLSPELVCHSKIQEIRNVSVEDAIKELIELQAL